jgi:hypothetical protein
MSERTPYFAGQIYTTGLQPETLLSAGLEKEVIDKCFNRNDFEEPAGCRTFSMPYSR